jgi:hypothetical protein
MDIERALEMVDFAAACPLTMQAKAAPVSATKAQKSTDSSFAVEEKISAAGAEARAGFKTSASAFRPNPLR